MTEDPPMYTVRAFPEVLPATAIQLEASKHRIQRLASASFDVEVAASLPVIVTPRCSPGATGPPVRVTYSLKRNGSTVYDIHALMLATAKELGGLLYYKQRQQAATTR
jgi:hypothetical protein